MDYKKRKQIEREVQEFNERQKKEFYDKYSVLCEEGKRIIIILTAVNLICLLLSFFVELKPVNIIILIIELMFSVGLFFGFTKVRVIYVVLAAFNAIHLDLTLFLDVKMEFKFYAIVVPIVVFHIVSALLFSINKSVSEYLYYKETA